MRIAILTELFHPHIGGTEVRLYEISKRLVRRGHEVNVFTIQYSPHAIQEEDLEAIHVNRYAYSSGYLFSDGFRSWSGVLKYSLSTVLRALGTDYDIYYFGQWPILHSLLTKPVVSPCIQEWCEVWYKKIATLEKILARTMNNHVAVSEFTKRRMVEFLNLPPDRITVIPNGVELQKFNQKSDKKRGRIVYVGRVVQHKGLDLLIEAFKTIHKKAPEVELYIAGSGAHLQTIKDNTQRLEGVYVLGHISETEKIRLLESSWLFIMPSSREGSSIALLEAMAAGTPVLTLNHPDNATKHFCTYGNGVIVPPSSTSVASAVLKLLSNENEWNNMSKAALDYARQCDWNLVVDRVEHYFRSVMRNN